MIIEIGIWTSTTSNAAIYSVLQTMGWVNASNVPIKTLQIDDVGTLVKTPAVLDGNGNIVTPAVLYPGYYMNVRFYGADADTLTNGLAQTDVSGNLLDIWTRTKLTTQNPSLTNFPVAGSQNISPTYKYGATTVFFFDLASGVKAGRMRVWQ